MSVHGMAVLLASCFNDYFEFSFSLEKKITYYTNVSVDLVFFTFMNLVLCWDSFLLFRDISLLAVMSISIPFKELWKMTILNALQIGFYSSDLP